MLKRLSLTAIGLILLLSAAVTINTLRQGSRQIGVRPPPAIPVDEKAVAEKLAGAVRFKTISSVTDPDLNKDQFLALHDYLQQRFPRVHATLKREVVGGLALLYTWQGRDAQAAPIAFLAHQDVVPIEPGTESKWTSPPFAGEIKDGYVWGRGTWDDKGNLIAQLEAIEMLIASGFQPRQTIYIISGADEEVTGQRGAAQIAKLFAQRHIKPEFIVDEGLFIGRDFVNGVAQPIAMIGIAEKGYLSVSLKARGIAGHSSAPPAPGMTSIAKLAEALRRLDDRQMPARLEGVARESLETLAPEMTGMQRVALSNLWLFKPLVESQLAKSAAMNTMLRTTTALTIVQAGNKENVIPQEASAVVNFRILPGDSREAVLRHVREVAGPDIEVGEIAGSTEPTPVSPSAAPSYQLLQRTLRSLFPDAIVAPGLYTAGSDSHYFAAISDNIYRFTPVRVKPEDLSRLHGTNERIATANLAELVRFYHQLIRNASLERPTP
jgi:carboxypeptidase PM20D1